MRELEHRLKNLLATVSAVLQQSRRNRRDPAAAIEDFERRLADLRRLHDCLSTLDERQPSTPTAESPGTSGDGVALVDLVELAVRPYGGPGGDARSAHVSDSVGGAEQGAAARSGRARGQGIAARVRTTGPQVLVPRSALLPLGTALCELATNAVKYGALSSVHGQVEVTWVVRPDTSGARGDVVLELDWIERDGPEVRPPTRRGYGSALLERGVTDALGGEARIDFAPEGLTCSLLLPFATLTAPADSGVAPEPDDLLYPPAPSTRASRADAERASAWEPGSSSVSDRP
ncbi:MAG: sensor histidine kinase [Planctomycetota bacterium]